MTHYDLIVIGAGSGNTIVTKDFADWNVAIIESGLFGGTCLNVGCIPTKMFVYPADLARSARHAPELGVDTRVDGVRWAEIRDRIFGRIDPIAPDGKAYRQGLPNVTVYDGNARFTGERRLAVTDPEGGPDHEITADKIVIATGSRAVVPEIEGLSDLPFHTSDTIMRLEELPARMTILGGGFIAAEFAHVFSAYGVQVTQLHRGPRLLAREDEQLSARFTDIAQRQWDVRLETELLKAESYDGGLMLHLSEGSTLETDVLLVATGRRANGDRLDLQAGGVRADAQDVVIVDDYLRTTADGVWALGDACNHLQLKHLANADARTIQHNLLHPDAAQPRDDRFVPSAVFTSPQLATVGVTEQEARKQGASYVTATHDFGDVAYGWAMEDTDHFVKLLADPGTDRLIGAHIIGPQASLLIQPLIQAMSFDQPVSTLARGQFWIHPALSEVVENALLKLAGAMHEN